MSSLQFSVEYVSLHSQIEKCDMRALPEYTISLSKLKNGSHQFKWRIEKSFFSHFEEPLSTDGVGTVNVEVEKMDSMLQLLFTIEGKSKVACDRCLAPIDLPINGQFHLILKNGIGEAEDAFVEYFDFKENELDLSKYIFEFFQMSKPVTNTMECEELENAPCDFDVLTKIRQVHSPTENSVWDTLKDIKIEHKKN